VGRVGGNPTSFFWVGGVKNTTGVFLVGAAESLIVRVVIGGRTNIYIIGEGLWGPTGGYFWVAQQRGGAI